MGTIERKLLPSDNMFITLWSHDKTLSSICRNGFHSLSEIIKVIIGNSEDASGITELSVRNQSQGWSYTIPIAFNVKISAKTQPVISSQRHGLQYLIPW